MAGSSYSYKLVDVDFQGHETLHGPVSVTAMPTELKLHGVYPNPSSDKVTVKLDLTAKGYVRLGIYNLAGELVKTLADEEMDAGSHEIRWDSRDEVCRIVPSGVYTYRVQSDETERSGKLILIR